MRLLDTLFGGGSDQAQGFMNDPNNMAKMGLIASLLSARKGSDIGSPIFKSAVLQNQQQADDRANRQSELQMLTQTYPILKQQDQMDQANASLSGTPYTPNPLLGQLEQKISTLYASPLRGYNPSASGKSATIPGLPPGQSAPVFDGSSGPGAPSMSPDQLGTDAAINASQGLPSLPQSPQTANSLPQLLKAANIPVEVARGYIATGNMKGLYDKITEALAPKNGAAGLTRINPQTGQAEVMGGNATPGQVPFVMGPDGQLVAKPIQGAAEEVARQKGLEAKATGGENLIDVPLGDGRMIKMRQADYLARLGITAPQAPQPQAMPTNADFNNASPGAANVNNAGRVALLKSELSQEPQGTPAYGALQKELGGMGTLGVTPNPGALRQQEAIGSTSGTNAANYENALNDRVRTGQDLMMRVEEARGALGQFQPGMGAGAREQIARVAQALPGVDPNGRLVQAINGGDVAAKQEFQKLAAQQAMETLKQSMGGSGRITQAEFKVFQANNPNIELDPRAIEKIYNFATRVYQRDSGEQQALSAYKQNGGDATQWPAQWTRQLQQSGVVKDQITAGGKPTGAWGIKRIN